MKSPLYNKIKNNSPGKIITSFTAGNFDLLHPGYIYTFEEAKRHSDRFIIFLQKDPSATRYTKYKPVIPYYERYKTLMAISYVDEVYLYQSEEELRELTLAKEIRHEALRIIEHGP